MYLNIISRVFGILNMMFVLYMSISIYNIFCGMAIVVDFVVDSFTIRPPSVSLILLFWAVRFPKRVIWDR